ncbi:hypothetical protein ACLEUK_01130 [Pseudescherichia vulneris]|jgi:hypothetical protein
MDSAKEIAKEMLDAIDVDSSGFWGAFGKGLVSFPVTLTYLGYDFIDTDHRRENQDDKFRLAKLIKQGVFNHEVIGKVIRVSLNDFASRINMGKIETVVKKISGSLAGKFAFTELTGVRLGEAITSKGVAAFFSGSLAGLVLTIGAEASRAIYTSRYLQERNPALHEKLQSLGDLDLLYYLVEDIVRPFENACIIGDSNPQKFDEVCAYFFGGL